MLHLRDCEKVERETFPFLSIQIYKGLRNNMGTDALRYFSKNKDIVSFLLTVTLYAIVCVCTKVLWLS